jgi:hypothetical protein
MITTKTIQPQFKVCKKQPSLDLTTTVGGGVVVSPFFSSMIIISEMYPYHRRYR